MGGVPAGEGPYGARWDRVVALLFLLAGVACVLALAAVRPNARGFGTHVQLGMEACSWAESYGTPCPTCGVTTAACHLVHLEPLRALRAQPFGAVLAAVGLGAAGYAAFCLVTRRSFVDLLVRLPFGKLLAGGLVLFFASWAYKYATFGS